MTTTFKHPTRVYRSSSAPQLSSFSSLMSTTQQLPRRLVQSYSCDNLNESYTVRRHVPNEVLLLMFSYLPVDALIRLRLVGKLFNTLASCVLVEHLAHQAQRSRILTQKAEQNFLDIEMTTLPALSHNSRFLRAIPIRQLTGLAYLKTPHIDTIRVAECLLRLHGSLKDDGSSAKWTDIRKLLSSMALREWLVNLRSNVTSVPYSNILETRRILEGMNVTYERMKTINHASYEMLIVVAAVIQFKENHETIETARRLLTKTASITMRTQQLLHFVAAASGCNHLIISQKESQLNSPAESDLVIEATIVALGA